MHKYEIEIKSLLGSEENAQKLIKKMRANDSSLKEYETHKQLNHYFVDGSLDEFLTKVEPLIVGDKDKFEHLKSIKNKIKDYTLRTRLADDKLILVLKTSINEEASANAKARAEFEWEINGTTLDELDKLILSCGFKYQAKWSRERTDYKYKDTNVSIDKNAGYGYLTEFEKVINDETKADETKAQLRNMMAELGIEELPQDRLERMFKHYNENWQDYYGTEKIFEIL